MQVSRFSVFWKALCWPDLMNLTAQLCFWETRPWSIVTGIESDDIPGAETGNKYFIGAHKKVYVSNINKWFSAGIDDVQMHCLRGQRWWVQPGQGVGTLSLLRHIKQRKKRLWGGGEGVRCRFCQWGSAESHTHTEHCTLVHSTQLAGIVSGDGTRQALCYQAEVIGPDYQPGGNIQPLFFLFSLSLF